MGKRGFAHLILVLAVAGIAGALLIVLQTSRKESRKDLPTQIAQRLPYWETESLETPTPTTNSHTPTAPDPYGFEAPSLPSTVSWTVVNKEEMFLNKLSWRDTRTANLKGEILLDGTEWRALKTLNSERERVEFYTGINPFEYFRSFLLKRRWEYRTLPSITISHYEFSVLNFAGNLNEMEGYFKEREGLIRIVYFSNNLDERFVEEGGQFIYPHAVEFRLFVSDLMPEEQLVRQITASTMP